MLPSWLQWRATPLQGRTYDPSRRELDWLRPAPSALDAMVAEFCRRYALLDTAQRSAVGSALTADESWTLFYFAGRMAILAMRDGDPQRLRDGSTALEAIPSESFDPRDLSQAEHTLRLAAARLGDMPHQAGSIAGRYRLIDTKYGLGLIGWGARPYAPSGNLAGLAVNVAELLEAQRYPDTSIEIGSQLPENWLLPEPRRGQVLGRIVAAGIVHASPWRVRPEHRNRRVIVFLAETQSTGDANLIDLLARAAEPDERPRFSVARQRLFGLVVGLPSLPGLAELLDAY